MLNSYLRGYSHNNLNANTIRLMCEQCTGVKHNGCGPKPTLERVQSGLQNEFVKSKNYIEGTDSQGCQ